LLIGVQRTAARSGETEEVRSPFDGSIVGVAPTAGWMTSSSPGRRPRGAAVWRRTPAHERMRIMLRAVLRPPRSPTRALYLRHIAQANEGCDFDFFGAGPPTPEPEIH